MNKKKNQKDLSISVHFDSQETDSVQLELDLRGEPVLFGLWKFTLQKRGKPLQAIDSWTEICVHREKGCEYLELDLPLSDNYRLQRFFLLDNTDRLLILGDTLLWDGNNTKQRLSERNDHLMYESTLFYSPKLRPKTFADSTEIFFQPNKPKSSPIFRVFPLALPEWKQTNKTGIVTGTLGIEQATLVLRQQTSGISMFAPLFFDFDANRSGTQYTWRHLTVGENMKKVPDDQAVGYRVQVNKEQFLLYRSMTPSANRTVLGHNLIDDFCFARFVPETGVETLIVIESEK
ncbi:MAG: hypothetical protein LBP87_07250 [Planctomycetaceae bacterium]|jgi:hypothetical protein|nr:hypothetical protein [Planctomycetaceae bacterium]